MYPNIYRPRPQCNTIIHPPILLFYNKDKIAKHIKPCSHRAQHGCTRWFHSIIVRHYLSPDLHHFLHHEIHYPWYPRFHHLLILQFHYLRFENLVTRSTRGAHPVKIMNMSGYIVMWCLLLKFITHKYMVRQQRYKEGQNAMQLQKWDVLSAAFLHYHYFMYLNKKSTRSNQGIKNYRVLLVIVHRKSMIWLTLKMLR